MFAPVERDDEGGRDNMKRRLRWTDAMVVCLLHLRLVVLRDEFAASVLPHARAATWEKLRDAFAEAMECPRETLQVLQLKNKWHVLRKEYTEISAREKQHEDHLTDEITTEASGGDDNAASDTAAIEYPSYWTTLVTYFSNADGMVINDPLLKGIKKTHVPLVTNATAKRPGDDRQLQPERQATVMSPFSSIMTGVRYRPIAKKDGSVLPATASEESLHFRPDIPLQTLPQPSESTHTKTARLKWTHQMIEMLLELRLGVLRDLFKRSRSSGQRRDAWTQLRDKFCFQMHTDMDVLQLKNKYNALRKEYLTLKQVSHSQSAGMEKKERGPVVVEEEPSYWEILTSYFDGIIEMPDGEQHAVTSISDRQSMTSTSLPLHSVGRNKASTVVVSTSPATMGLPETRPASQDGQTVSGEDGNITSGEGSARFKRMQWDNGMVASLLELRLKTLATAFSASRSPAHLRDVWEKLRLKFSLQHNLVVEVLQLKNKFNALRKEYVETRDAIQNQREVHVPSYWSVLLVYFGGRNGAERSPLSAESACNVVSSNRKRQLGNSQTSHLDSPQSKRKSGNESVNSSALTDERVTETINESRATFTNSSNQPFQEPPDTIQTLLTIVKAQQQRQDELRSLLQRQQQQFEQLVADSAATNAALIRFLKAQTANSTENCGST